MSDLAPIGVLLRAAGVGLVALGLLHAGFPRWFRWKEGLAGLSLLDRQLMHVHTLFIGAMLVLFGALSFVAAAGLDAPTPLLRGFLGGLAVFWLLRLWVQLFVFDRSLWAGHRGRTALHVSFLVLWTGLTGLYALAAWSVS